MWGSTVRMSQFFSFTEGTVLENHVRICGKDLILEAVFMRMCVFMYMHMHVCSVCSGQVRCIIQY